MRPLPDHFDTRPELTLGPFFVRSSQEHVVVDEVAHVGMVMEMATVHAANSVPIYRKVQSFAPDKCELEALLVHAEDLPCEVLYMPFFGARTPKGEFIPLEALLVGLYKNFRMNRTIFSLLDDLWETASLNACWHRPSHSNAGYLDPKLERAGFLLINEHSYGRRLFANIGWKPKQERQELAMGNCLFTCMLEFRPKPDGSLGKGTLEEPRESGVCSLLFHEVRRLINGDAIDLMSDDGKKLLLSAFKWTPLAHMTNKQAREARIKFIRDHPELAAQPRALAAGLLKEGLYAESTTISQIIKFLPSLVLVANG